MFWLNIPNKHLRTPLESYTICVLCKWANEICIMMIMRGSSMHKAEHDRKAIMYPAYGTHHRRRTISEEIKLNPAFPEHIIEILWTVRKKCCDFIIIINDPHKSHNSSGCLTHWGRVTHICVSKLTSIGSDNGLSPGRRQAIIWTNAGILFIRTLGTSISEILGEIHSFSFWKMHLKMASAKWRLFGLGLNELSWRKKCWWGQFY